MTTRSGGTEGGNLSRSLEHLIGSRWYSQGNVAGILALGSAATTTEETLVSLDALTGAEDILHCIHWPETALRPFRGASLYHAALFIS